MVGNAYRVDVMCLGAIVDDFIDTEYLWSLDFKKGILNVAVDIKSKYIFYCRVFFSLFITKVSSDLSIQSEEIKISSNYLNDNKDFRRSKVYTVCKGFLFDIIL